MIYVKRALFFGLLGLLGWFVYQNQGFLGKPVELVFFNYRQTLVLGFWLILSFTAGALLFMLVDLPQSFTLRRDLARRTQELARVQFELTRATTQLQQAQAQVPGHPSPAALPTLSPPPQQTNPPDLEKRLGL